MLFVRNSFISKVHIDYRGKNKILYSMQIIQRKEGMTIFLFDKSIL